MADAPPLYFDLPIGIVRGGEVTPTVDFLRFLENLRFIANGGGASLSQIGLSSPDYTSFNNKSFELVSPEYEAGKSNLTTPNYQARPSKLVSPIY